MPKIPLRHYQKRICQNTCRAIDKGDNAQVHMFCGLGKTRVSIAVAASVVPIGQTTAVLVPSRTLAAQTIAAWHALIPNVEAMAVCGDDHVAHDPTRPEELCAPVTTDVTQIAAWLENAALRPRVIISTLRSSHVLAAAVRRTVPLGLVIFDEAHHLAGLADSFTRRVLDLDFLPTERRLFMTATPRLKLREAHGVATVGMNQESVFGPVTGTYTYAERYADGFLSDYRILAVVVTDEQVREMLRARGAEYITRPGGPTLRMLASQIALARVREQYGVNKVLTFHPRVSEAREFAETLHEAVAGVAPEHVADLRAAHVDGRMKTHERGKALELLTEPGEGFWSVVASCRCVGEGHDVPCLNALLFAAVKQSRIEIAQNIGRGLRIDTDPKRAYHGPTLIILPVLARTGGLLEDDFDLDLDTDAFANLVHVVRTMREHDEMLAAELDARRKYGGGVVALPEKIQILLPAGVGAKVFDSIVLQLIRGSTLRWSEDYNAAVAFFTNHGHLLVPKGYLTAEKFPLGAWIAKQRQPVSRGYNNPELRELLDSIGMVSDVRTGRHAEVIAAVATFREQHGHLRVPTDHLVAIHGKKVPLEPRLAWLRRARAQGSLPKTVIKALDVHGFVWSPHDAAWWANYTRLEAFHATYGHCAVPLGFSSSDGDEVRLDIWVAEQRRAYREKRLAPERFNTLDRLGFSWSPSKSPSGTALAIPAGPRPASAAGNRFQPFTTLEADRAQAAVPLPTSSVVVRFVAPPGLERPRTAQRSPRPTRRLLSWPCQWAPSMPVSSRRRLPTTGQNPRSANCRPHTTNGGHWPAPNWSAPEVRTRCGDARRTRPRRHDLGATSDPGDRRSSGGRAGTGTDSRTFTSDYDEPAPGPISCAARPCSTRRPGGPQRFVRRPPDCEEHAISSTLRGSTLMEKPPGPSPSAGMSDRRPGALGQQGGGANWTAGADGSTMRPSGDAADARPSILIAADIFGVLVGLDTASWRTQLARISGLAENEFMELWHESGLGEAWDTGALNLAGLTSGLRNLLTAPDLTAQTVAGLWRGAVGAVDPVLGPIAARLSRERRLIIASNNNPEHWPLVQSLLVEAGVSPNTPRVLSHQVGASKPSPAFYAALVKLTEGQNVVLIDDRLSNIEAATACGITAYHHTSAARTADMLTELLDLTKPAQTRTEGAEP